MTPDHGVDDGTPKFRELLVIHINARLQISDVLFFHVVRQERKVVAKRAEGKCFFYLFHRTIGLVD